MAKIEIYSAGYCPYCFAAKNLLKQKGVEYIEYPVDQEADLRAEMESRSGRRTVPQIFIDDEHIGGFDDISALDKSGGLDSKLGIS